MAVLPRERATTDEPRSLPSAEAENTPPRPVADTPLPEPEAAPPPAPKAERLMSLDAFRGLTILGMLLVNNIALDRDTPQHLTHAEWSGRVHIADLVFPWFLLIVGVAVPWALASHQRKGLGNLRWVGKAVGRSLSLVLMGCVVDSTVQHQLYLGLGVLQIIGLAYLVGALLAGLLPARGRAAAAGLLLVGYWALIRFAPLPNLGPGHFTETDNVIRYLNETYLNPFGLRGLLSVIPTGALVLLGTFFGEILRKSDIRPARRLALLTAWGGAFTIAGLAWSLDLPMNKPLWSPPYILFTAGMGGLVLAAMYALIDTPTVRKVRWWSLPLVVFGVNAIVAYVAPILFKINVLQTWRWAGTAAGLPNGSNPTLEQALQNLCFTLVGRTNGGWLYTALYIGFWWLVLLYLYRRQWFVRL
jgi:predicted acyltransferase